MKNISKLTLANGSEVALKDKTARETLATKQTKLVAGNGIKIEGNKISVVGGGGSLDVDYTITHKGALKFKCYSYDGSGKRYFYQEVATEKWFVVNPYQNVAENPSQITQEVQTSDNNLSGTITIDEYGLVYWGYDRLSEDSSNDIHDEDVVEHKTDTIDEIIPCATMDGDFYEAPQGKAVKTVKSPISIVEFKCYCDGHALGFDDNNYPPSGCYYETTLEDGVYTWSGEWYKNGDYYGYGAPSMEIGTKFTMYLQMTNGVHYKTNFVYVLTE